MECIYFCGAVVLVLWCAATKRGWAASLAGLAGMALATPAGFMATDTWLAASQDVASHSAAFVANAILAMGAGLLAGLAVGVAATLLAQWLVASSPLREYGLLIGTVVGAVAGLLLNARWWGPVAPGPASLVVVGWSAAGLGAVGLALGSFEAKPRGREYALFAFVMGLLAPLAVAGSSVAVEALRRSGLTSVEHVSAASVAGAIGAITTAALGLAALVAAVRAFPSTARGRGLACVGVVCGIAGLTVGMRPVFTARPRMGAGHTTPPGAKSAAVEPVATLRPGPSGRPFSVALSADGRIAAVCTTDGICLWDARTGQWMRTISADVLDAVALSPDGRRVAGTLREGKATVWDTASGQVVTSHQLPDRAIGLPGRCNWMAFSSDGRRVACAVPFAVDTLVVFDAASGAGLPMPDTRGAGETQIGHTGSVGAVAVSRDGRVGASVCSDNVVKVWAPASGTVLRSCKVDPEHVADTVMSADGKVLALRMWNDSVLVLDTGTLRRRCQLPPRSASFAGPLALSYDGSVLLCSRPNAPLARWSTRTGAQIPDPPASTLVSDPLLLAVSPKNHLAVVEGRHRVMQVLDVRSGKVLRAWTYATDPIRCMAFMPDGRTLVCSTHGVLVYWDVATARLVKTTPSFVQEFAYSMVVSPDGRWIALLNGQGKAYLLSTNPAKLVRTFAADQSGKTLAFDGAGRLVLGQGSAGIQASGVATGERRWVLERPEDPAVSMEGAPAIVSADGRQIARGTRSGRVILGSAAGTRDLPGIHEGGVTALAFSPDGRMLATGGKDGRVLVRSLPSGRADRLLRPGFTARTLGFSGDGRLLVCGGGTDGQGAGLSGSEANGQVRLWHAATGKLVSSVSGWCGPVPPITLSRDGSRALAVPSFWGPAAIYRTAGWRVALTLGAANAQVAWIAFAPNGELLTADSGGGSWTLKRWDGRTGAPLRQFAVSSAVCALSPDGRSIASVRPDGALAVREAGVGRVTHAIRTGVLSASHIAFSPDGSTVWVGGAHALAGIDVRGGRTPSLRRITLPADTLAHTFTSDGRLCAAATYRRGTWAPTVKVHVLDTASGRTVQQLSGFMGAVGRPVFSPDGRWLATGGDDHLLRIWDAKAGTMRWSVRTGSALCHAFSGDSRLVVAGDGTVMETSTGVVRRRLGGQGALAAVSADGSRAALAESYTGRVNLFVLPAATAASR